MLCLLIYSASHHHCLAYISDRVQSVATSAHCQGGFPVFHMPNVRRNKNSYETQGACVRSHFQDLQWRGMHCQPIYVTLSTKNYSNGC